MITLSDVSFSYGKTPVLSGLTFSAEKGKLTAVLGKNGAGKSTLFRCILGLLTGYEGSIALDGEEIRGMTASALARRVAYIPQSHYPSFNYSVFDMVLMGTTNQVSLLRSPQKKQLDCAREALETLGISALGDRGFANLSGGEQQLVLIARALAQKADVLLMDEPTSSLDYGNQFRVMERVCSLAGSGYTILMSSHNPQHVLTYADCVAALHQGKLLCKGKPEDVLTPALMETLYGVRVGFENTGGGRIIIPLRGESA